MPDVPDEVLKEVNAALDAEAKAWQAAMEDEFPDRYTVEVKPITIDE